MISIHQEVSHKIWGVAVFFKMKVVLLTIMFEYVTPVHVVLERLFRELHSKGIRAVRQQSEIITATEEYLLWEKSEMGTHSPSALLNSVFFFITD